MTAPARDFFANLRDMNEVPKWSMPTLAYHEGVPGHHWQLSTAEELKGVPQFRKVLPFTASQRAGRFTANGWRNKSAGRQRSVLRSGRLRDELSARFDWSSILAFTRNTDPRTSDRLHARENRDGRERS